MIVEVAIATRTAPGDWWDEDAATIATAIDVLVRQAEEIEKSRKGGRHG